MHALCEFTATFELQFYISDSMGKIVQNVKILLVSQSSNLSLKIKPYSSIRVQGYTQFPKQSPRYQIIKISHKSRQQDLPRKIQFLTEARLLNLRLPLNL